MAIALEFVIPSRSKRGRGITHGNSSCPVAKDHAEPAAGRRSSPDNGLAGRGRTVWQAWDDKRQRLRTWSLAARLVLGYGSIASYGLAFAAQAAKHPLQASLAIAAELKLNALEQPESLSGQIELSLKSPVQSFCFYLPYQHKAAQRPSHPLKHFDQAVAARSALTIPPGSCEVRGSDQLTLVRSDLLRVDLPEPSRRIQLDFAARFFEAFQAAGDDYVFEGFYPQPLAACPDATMTDSALPLSILPTHLTAQLKVPAPWQIAGPHSETSGPPGVVHLETLGRSLAFAMAHHYHRKRVVSKEGQVELWALDPQFFAASEETIVHALAAHSRWFGPLPVPSLAIVESRAEPASHLAGLIVLNRPRQFFFEYLQKNMLNWQHWTLSALIAGQWYGAAISVSDPADDWLLAGITDFINSQFLGTYPKRQNLFNHFERAVNYLSVDYLQMQEATASLLHRSSPQSVLTDGKLATAQSAASQSPLLFVKHALAMRYLQSITGVPLLRKFFKRFTRAHLFTSISPSRFSSSLAEAMHEISPHRRDEVERYLRLWWTKLGWSDLALLNFDRQRLPSGQWLASAEFRQHGEFELPSQVGFRDKGGQTYLVVGEPRPSSRGLYKAVAITELEPTEVTLDPNHFLFDPNRFDNSSRTPRLHFFPGSASTLSDADYTAIWVPYALRRPGEPFSLALQSAIFRYLNDGLYVKLEGSPSTHQGSYHLRYEHTSAQTPLGLELSLAQNYTGEKTSAMSASATPLLASDWAQLMLLAALRYRQIAGQSQSGHPTAAIGLRLTSKPPGGLCHFSLYGEREESLGVSPAGAAYTRLKGLATSLCHFPSGFELALRTFAGLSRARHGELPSTATFRVNDLGEAAVRVDEADLARSHRIQSLGVDLYLPFSLPLPANTMILSKQLRFRTFYDFGMAADDKSYRAGGIGFTLPFGGDVMGLGTLTLSRFSLLAVLYSNINGRLSRRPHILFDLTGEL